MKQFLTGVLVYTLCLPLYAGVDYNITFTAQERYEDVTVAWVPSDDVVQTCNMATRIAGSNVKYDASIKACAVVYQMSRTCVIYTANTLDLAILGHEVRHCFEGAWHK